MASMELKLPGFRFHPTEEELLDFYLRNVVLGKKLNFNIIGYLDIYRYNPWELPGLAQIGEREWYFFVPRDRKTGNGGRPNRTTEHGFWKATGSDRAIRSAAEPRRQMGLKKTLVFYQGRAPRGTRTDWVMNEYRLPDNINTTQKEDIVLCKIYRKATSLKELEQRAAMEEESKALNGSMSIVADNNSSSNSDQDWLKPNPSSVPVDCAVANREFPKEMEVTSKSIIRPAMAFPELQVPTSGLEFPKEMEHASKSIIRPAVALPELQVPTSGLEWMQDPFLTQLRSPWLDQWSPYASLLNF